MGVYALQLGLEVLRQLGNLAPHPPHDDLPISAFNIEHTPLNFFSDFCHRRLLLNLISERIDDPNRGVPALPGRRGPDSSGRRVSR